MDNNEVLFYEFVENNHFLKITFSNGESKYIEYTKLVDTYINNMGVINGK